MFTLVGAGHKPYSKVHRSQFGSVPEGVHLVEDLVTAFDPDKGHVTIGSGQKVRAIFCALFFEVSCKFGDNNIRSHANFVDRLCENRLA